MAEGKEPVEELELDEAQAQGAGGGSPDDLLEDFDDLLGGDAQTREAKSGAPGDGDMDLTELEAFLDDFNRSLDGSDDGGKPEGSKPTESGASGDADDQLEGWGEELWDEESPAQEDEAAVLGDALEVPEDEATVLDDVFEVPEGEAAALDDAFEVPEDEAAVLGDAPEAQEDEAAALDDAFEVPEDETAALDDVPEAPEDEAAVLDDGLEALQDEPSVLEDPLEGFDPAAEAGSVDSGEIEALDAFGDEVPPDDGEAESKMPLEADELDLSFADEQEQGAGQPDAVSGSGGGDNEFQELDLDGFDDTVAEEGAADAPAEASVEVPAEPPEEMEPVGEMPVSEAEPSPEPPQPTAVSRPSPAAAPESGRKFTIAAALAGIGLLVAGAAGFLAYDLSGRVDALNRTVTALQQQSQQPAADGALAERVDALSREATKLGARLSELAIIIEGPMSHLRESNERDIRNVVARVEQVETGLQELRASASRPRPAPARTAPRSAEPKPWVVNIVSLSNRNTALEEKARLEGLGIDTTLQQVNVDGRPWYRLRVVGFASKVQAEDYATQVRRKAADLGGAWVTRE